MSDESSFGLVLRAKAGDGCALDSLMRRYFPRLRRWVRSDLPFWARDFNDTEDLVQETLLSAFRNLPNLRMDSRFSFRSYMREAARNRVHDERKRASRKPRVGPISGFEVSDKPSAIHHLISKEDLWRCRASLARLRPDDRKMILLRLSRPDSSFKQLAALAEKPSEDAARIALARALSRLAREMRLLD